jgi:hypothetical protein
LDRRAARSASSSRSRWARLPLRYGSSPFLRDWRWPFPHRAEALALRRGGAGAGSDFGPGSAQTVRENQSSNPRCEVEINNKAAIAAVGLERSKMETVSGNGGMNGQATPVRPQQPNTDFIPSIEQVTVLKQTSK